MSIFNSLFGGSGSSVKRKIVSKTSDSTSIEFSSLDCEPSWFVMVGVGSNKSSFATASLYYDGSSKTAVYLVVSNSKIYSYQTTFSFSYSSGDLRITSQSTISQGTYRLYYL